MIHAEDRMQISCVEWFSYAYPKLAKLLHHSPNGGKRTAFEAKIFKAMGTRAGFPDLILLFPSGKYHALLIEMKTATGRQSKSQKEYQKLVEYAGYKYVICRSFDEFRKVINDYFCNKE